MFGHNTMSYYKNNKHGCSEPQVIEGKQESRWVLKSFFFHEQTFRFQGGNTPLNENVFLWNGTVFHPLMLDRSI